MDITRLEKAAADCGFELSPELGDGGLKLKSTQFPEMVTVKLLGRDRFELLSSSTSLFSHIQQNSEGVRLDGWNSLYETLEMASATARNLPNRVALRYLKLTSSMPKSTEAERLVVQRVGQDLFRSALLDYWQGSCCVTGLTIPQLLRASHIKPWARCDSDEERLDVFNGLLLAPHLDALFDGGWISVEDTGVVKYSPSLTSASREQLGLPQELVVGRLGIGHFPYLAYHREVVFKGAVS